LSSEVQERKEMSLRAFKPYPKYKDSGVEWLGKIPTHWEAKRLKRLFKVVNGSTPRSEQPSYWDGDIPWVTPDDLGELTSRELLEPRRYITEDGYRSCGTSMVPSGSLVLSTRAPIGHLTIAGVNLCTNQGCRSLVFRKDHNRYFFYYLLFAAHSELESWGQGSTFKELAKSKLEYISLVDLPLDEQLAIVSFLDRETAKIDALISKRERLIELLQEKRAAMISQAVAKGLDPNVPMKDSGVDWLEEIPAHWEVKRLKNIVHLNPEVLPETTDSDYLMQYIDITNVDEVSGVNPPDEMPFDNAPSRARRIVRPGDTILSTVRTYLKAAAYFENPPDNLIVSTGFAVLRPDIGIYPPYIFALVRCQPFIESVVSNSVGVAYPAISPSELAALPVWVPPDVEEQKIIVEYLERERAKIDSLIVNIREGIDRLREYRTALISAAVTGKINVRGETT